MGKRSDFVRRERDFYPTPPEAVEPLLPHLPINCFIWEPCAGNGALGDILSSHGCEIFMSDIEPKRDDILLYDCSFFDPHIFIPDKTGLVVTNPPWDFDFISNFLHYADWPVWFLLSADFAHNKRSAPYMKRCERIVSVGRVKWIANSPHTAKDNCAWYLFNPYPVAVTAFYPRLIT